MKLTKLKEFANMGMAFASEHRTSLMVGGGIAGFVIAGVTAVRVSTMNICRIMRRTLL